jgi:hypothetical protein
MEKIEEQNSLVSPYAPYERGEIERVSQIFGGDDKKQFVEEFIEKVKSTIPMNLSEDDWGHLENSDSYDIAPDDWETVRYHAVDGNPDRPRDWESIKKQFENEHTVPPMILKMGDTLHLVSGNTRLMVARALGKIPKVAIIDMSDFTIK